MARADFYILNGNSTAPRFSCAIAGKAWAQGNSVYIMVRDIDAAEKIDALLWTYQDISFLPHRRIDEVAKGEAPVVIGWPGSIPPTADVIINLTDSIPDCVARYQRVVEIVTEDPLDRDRGRHRYKGYREMGFELFNHDIKLEK